MAFPAAVGLINPLGNALLENIQGSATYRRRPA
jgi:hypothetical protein